MALEFDAASHTYRNDGIVVPSVTQVIRAALGDPFARVPADVLERKRKIGEAAHKACELDSRGELDEATVHPAVVPYLEAWRAFVREARFEIVISEERAYQHTYGYAGQPDFVGSLGDKFAKIDLKTGLPGPLAALQTAGYERLPPAGGHRFALQALPNGRYKILEYTDPGDWPDFLACLRIFRLKERIE